MASHLSTEQIDQIVSLLDGWPTGTKLTWEALLRLVLQRLRIRPTRQALSNHERIAIAFRTRKAALRNSREISDGYLIPTERVRRLKAENDRLGAENQLLRERFERWMYNAYRHGLKEDELDAPRMPVDRGRTD